MSRMDQPADMEGILKVTKFPRAHLFGLRRDGSGRNIAGASFEEATQGSLCESIRAGQMVEHALLLHISEEVTTRGCQSSFDAVGILSHVELFPRFCLGNMQQREFRND